MEKFVNCFDVFFAKSKLLGFEVIEDFHCFGVFGPSSDDVVDRDVLLAYWSKVLWR